MITLKATPRDKIEATPVTLNSASRVLIGPVVTAGPYQYFCVIFGNNKEVIGEYGNSGLNEIALTGINGTLATTLDNLCVIGCRTKQDLNPLLATLGPTARIGRGVADNNGRFSVLR
ncbi:hypothetical protein [Sorangium sp. So ce1078]|uniref:hypothetical protein n=1 Tax=Sorangium sp. So ce1078 TaxID=3133329 RepID=UPI003F5DB529